MRNFPTAFVETPIPRTLPRMRKTSGNRRQSQTHRELENLLADHQGTDLQFTFETAAKEALEEARSVARSQLFSEAEDVRQRKRPRDEWTRREIPCQRDGLSWQVWRRRKQTPPRFMANIELPPCDNATIQTRMEALTALENEERLRPFVQLLEQCLVSYREHSAARRNGVLIVHKEADRLDFVVEPTESRQTERNELAASVAATDITHERKLRHLHALCDRAKKLLDKEEPPLDGGAQEAMLRAQMVTDQTRRSIAPGHFRSLLDDYIFIDVRHLKSEAALKDIETVLEREVLDYIAVATDSIRRKIDVLRLVLASNHAVAKAVRQVEGSWHEADSLNRSIESLL